MFAEVALLTGIAGYLTTYAPSTNSRDALLAGVATIARRVTGLTIVAVLALIADLASTASPDVQGRLPTTPLDVGELVALLTVIAGLAIVVAPLTIDACLTDLATAITSVATLALVTCFASGAGVATDITILARLATAIARDAGLARDALLTPIALLARDA